MAQITFKPKAISKKLLTTLNPRTKEIVVNRYGLEKGERMTLEAIGKTYDITRERVRQIENFALATIKKSKEYKEHAFIFEELRSVIEELGSVVSEEHLMESISKDPVIQNHINLYLALGEEFKKHKEDDHFKSHFSIDDKISGHVRDALHKLYQSINEEDLIKEEEIYERFVGHLSEVVGEYKTNKAIINRYLSLSKVIGKNQLNEWGRMSSPHVKARGIKDYAYLIMRRKGEPMHFKEVALEINKTFGKKAHVATCHNELIKDGRFVLVGRGMYGLKDWGHTGGVVRDVIKQVLKEAGKSLPKDEIIKRVLAKRIVKPNTVLVNLQNSKFFKKVAGEYALA
ncbi:MAG: HARE-type protein [Patescibacteria group bacterium]|nr:HARE-type protein [Patescibacteria group bacterium]